MDSSPKRLTRPDVFSTGARIVIEYTPVQIDPNAGAETTDKADGYIIKDTADVLAVEEYQSLHRIHQHRHLLIDCRTLEVYSQTAYATRLVGAVKAVELLVPPWEDYYQDIDGYSAAFAPVTETQGLIQEGVWKFPQPADLSVPDEWPNEMEITDPLPTKVYDHAGAETELLTPAVDFSVLDEQ